MEETLHGTPMRKQLIFDYMQAGCMFWGCIRIGVVGHLVDVPGICNAWGYLDNLQNHLTTSSQQIFGCQHKDFVFQQDDIPLPDLSRNTTTWLE